MKGRFEGRSVLITGGSGGIGQALAEAFVREEASVALADRNGEAVHRAATALRAAGARATALVGDVSSSADCDRMVEEACSAFGRLDVLVNNAAVLAYGDLADTSDADWHRQIATVLSGTFFMSRAALGRMRDGEDGRIINVSSAAGVRGLNKRGAYGAAKGGVVALTRALAVEVGRRGITVNAIAPGPVETPLVSGHSPAVRQAWLRMLSVKRYAEPGEIAATVTFLASREAGYMTGQTLCVDGGFTAGVDLERDD